MSYEAKGKLLVKSDEQQISERFRKREFVIEIEDGMYPQQVKFQLTQDRCSLLDDYGLNDEINVHFNLKGRAYQKNSETIYFTNLEAWRIESVATHQVEPPPPVDDIPPPEIMSESDMDSDNLPF